MKVVDVPISSTTFEIVENCNNNLDRLTNLTSEELRPFLPLLVRSSLVGDVVNRKPTPAKILAALSGIDAVNSIITLLSVDFQALEVDVKKELQLRQKLGNREQDSILIQSLANSITIEFERCDGTRKFRLVLSETLFIMSQMHETRTEYYMKVSDLFDNWVYLEDICDTVCIALVELPNLLNLNDVCEAMLHVNYGPWIICRLVANMPDSFLEVCFHLISNGDKCEEDTEGGLIRLEALKMLAQMNPKQSLIIRARCVEQCKMPALTIYLSLSTEDIEHNFIPFLSGILLGNDQQSRMWFSAYIKSAQKRKADSTNSLTKMREALWTYLRNTVKEPRENKSMLNENAVVQASSLLRLCCALKGIAGFKLHEDEMGDLVGLITVKAPNSPPGYRFVTLGLCTLLACPSLLANSEQEKTIIEWIKSLLRQEPGHSSLGVNSSFGEVLLLMAIHFHSNQINAICDLVCQTLGMKIPIRSNTISKIRQMFVQEIFTEQVVTAHAVKVPVTVQLNGDLIGYLPVHCIYQLIKSRAFTKHKVPIKDWIYRQLMSTKFPIHPVLPPLLEVYTQSILVPGTGTTSTGAKIILELTNEPLSDEEVLGVFQNFQTSNLVPQLLVLYYVLLYEDSRLTNCRNLISMGKKVKIYSSKLFSQIPIKFLLQQAQKNQFDCGGLFPSLLKLLTTHFPQLCIVNEWLEESGMNSTEETSIYGDNNKVLDEESFEDREITKAFVCCVETPIYAIKLLQKCKRITPQQLWPHAKEIVQQIKIIIHASVPRMIQDLFRDVWYQLNNIFPRHLWEMTSNSLLPHGSVSLSVEELAIDPLQLLRCDPQVYRCAPILHILLHILAASVAGSKYFLSKHLVENPSSNHTGVGQSDNEREELKMALVAVQDSTAVQILLEACLPQPREKDEVANDLCLKEIQSLICSYLHQIFIADPNLAKLVHFQGYPLELLPVTVRGIPSMHICLDFIPELLSQPETEKQVFAIQLISYISMQYALPKSYGIAKIALSTMNAMTAGAVSDERAEFFIPTLSALERFCEAFPPLTEDVVNLLLNLGRICTSQNSVERNRMCKVVRNKFLLRRIHETFNSISKNTILDKRIF